MNGIFFLIPFLVIASLGIYQADAQTTITGYNYFDTANPDGTRTWSPHEPYVFDGNNWVPYIKTGNTVQTDLADVTLNNDGSFTWNGKFTDRIVAKYADITNLNSWTYPNTLNNDTPDISWSNNEFVSSKIKSGIGKLDYKYVLNNGNWKTQLEATNLSGLTTKVFGFDQIVDLESDTIRFGDTTRNLDNFNGITFDKEFLDANRAKILDLLNGVNFDFDLGYENLYSVTVYDTGANKSRLVFDYRTSEILPPGETLVIDPTFGYTTGTVGRVYSATCNSSGTSAGTGAEPIMGASSGVCYISWFYWDISSINDEATITDVTIRYDTTNEDGATDCDFVGISDNLSGMSATQRYQAVWASATIFVNNDPDCDAVSNDKILDLGATAVTDVQDELGVDDEWGFGGLGSATSGENYTQLSATFELQITYTVGSPPNPVTVLTASNISTNSLRLDWNAPTSFGSGTFQTYTVNMTTPWGQPLTFKTNSTALNANVTGLTFGTDYSFRVSAVTEIAYNTTGSYIRNVTTTSNTYSLPPTSLVATSNSPTQINLQWVASTIQNILGYKIERETPQGSGWNTLVANTTNTNIYYNNTGLTSNIIYNYRVSAMNATGFSSVSNTYAMTTYHLPDAVDDLTGTATNLSTINLSWSAPTSYAPAITGYMINGSTPTGEPVDILNANTGSTATTATAFNIAIGQEYSFRVSPITVHGKNASGNIWNGSTIQTFVIGDLSNPDITNEDDFAIFFDRTDLNSTAIQLDVTYPNSYDLSCDFSYKYARTNQTYSGLSTVPSGTDDQVATFTLVNATGDLVQVRCWDGLTGDESKYVITITSFPFLEQINNLRSGEYGTFFQIGAFDGVMLIIIFLGMVGLNRTTPIVGVIFVVVTTLVMSYFELITYPIIMYPALIMMIVWAFVTTRKDD